jgi:hypothetical protein
MTDGAKIIPLRRKLKGGRVALLYRPGHMLVVHLDNHGEETELEKIEDRSVAELVGLRYAAKFGAQYAGELFG